MVTPAIQDYLKAIYNLGQARQNATTNAIAERISVSQASVTGMLRKLAELKLIVYKKYYGVALTPAGRKIALETLRHHRLLECYLVEALGYTWDEVHDEAERLEHVISEAFEERVAQALGHPKTDPHGAPIPTRDGHIEERDLHPLSAAEAGQQVRIAQVPDQDAGMLRYLGQIGIYPEVVVEVVERAPFEGPVVLQIGQRREYLGRPLANKILVAQV